MDASSIYQRTESGRSEIRTKMNGLTQSERLALIVVDGVTPYAELRRKLKGLAEERFERALNNLLKKSLIFEVLLPDEESVQEEFEPAVVDRFLQQDPMDPVTIMIYDLDDELEAETKKAPTVVLPEKEHVIQPTPAPPVIMPVTSSQSVPVPPKQTLRITSVDFYIPLEKQGAPDAPRRDGASQSISGVPSRASRPPIAAPAVYEPAQTHFAWGQWIIGIGVIVIVASILFKLLH